MTVPLRVLLVEDMEDDALLILRQLRRAEYETTHRRIETKHEMLSAIRSETFDVVLSDHNLPMFSSFGAIEAMRDAGVDLPLVVVSGNIGEDAVTRLIKAGAYDYVMKSDLRRLGGTIERALGEHRMRLERRRALDALRESEERFSLAVQGSRDGIWDYNLLSGHVYYAPRFYEMLGLETNELAPTIESVVSRIHPDDQKAAIAAFRTHLEERVPFGVELRLLMKDGQWRWFQTRGQALWDDAGHPLRMAGSISDLTAWKRREEELREKLALIEQQQMAIRELSAPIVEVWHGVLMLPVMGSLDAARTEEMITAVLDRVSATQSRYVIVDLTGVSAIDSATAQHIVRLTKAIALLGAQGIVVGMQAQVAQAVVSLGVELGSVRTLANLHQALLLCMDRRGSTVSRPRVLERPRL